MVICVTAPATGIVMTIGALKARGDREIRDVGATERDGDREDLARRGRRVGRVDR
jgi:hypothetical protein